MPVSKNQRRARHEQAESPTLGRGNPSAVSGRVGEQQFRNISGKGLVHMVRTETGWNEMSSSKASTTAGDTADAVLRDAVSVTTGASGGGGGGGGTVEITNNSITLNKIETVSTDTILGRTTANDGNVESLTATQAAAVIAEADSAGNDPDMFLSGTGIFREVSLGAGSIASLTDTVLQGLADGDLLSLYEPNEQTSQWRNYTRASIVRPQISATSPVAYNNSTGVITHETGAGKNHIPTGGSSGEFLKYSSSGVAVWATPSYTTNTNTWRDIDDTPVNGVTDQSISSNWAYDHDADASAHHSKYTDANAVSAINATSSITTTCDSPDVNHHVKADWTQGTSSHDAYIQNKPNVEYTSAITLAQAQTAIGYGNGKLVPAVGNAGEFLSHNGTFDEISVSTSMAALNDTALQSLSDRQFLYYDNATSYWKNTNLVAGDIPAHSTDKLTSGTLPVSRGGTGATSGYNNSNWDTAHTDRLKWDGGSTGLTASTGRTSLALNTGNDVQFDSFGVGTAASGTTGEIRATNEVTAYYSDDRLKTKYGNIKKALEKVCSLNGFHYSPNDLAESLGYDTSQKKVGVSAQEVLKVLPEAVTEAPIDPQYHTVQYEKLVPLLIEAIKELSERKCGCGSK